MVGTWASSSSRLRLRLRGRLLATWSPAPTRASARTATGPAGASRRETRRQGTPERACPAASGRWRQGRGSGTGEPARGRPIRSHARRAAGGRLTSRRAVRAPGTRSPAPGRAPPVEGAPGPPPGRRHGPLPRRRTALAAPVAIRAPAAARQAGTTRTSRACRTGPPDRLGPAP